MTADFALLYPPYNWIPASAGMTERGEAKGALQGAARYSRVLGASQYAPTHDGQALLRPCQPSGRAAGLKRRMATSDLLCSPHMWILAAVRITRECRDTSLPGFGVSPILVL